MDSVHSTKGVEMLVKEKLCLTHLLHKIGLVMGLLLASNGPGKGLGCG